MHEFCLQTLFFRTHYQLLEEQYIHHQSPILLLVVAVVSKKEYFCVYLKYHRHQSILFAQYTTFHAFRNLQKCNNEVFFRVKKIDKKIIWNHFLMVIAPSSTHVLFNLRTSYSHSFLHLFPCFCYEPDTLILPT